MYHFLKIYLGKKIVKPEVGISCHLLCPIQKESPTASSSGGGGDSAHTHGVPRGRAVDTGQEGTPRGEIGGSGLESTERGWGELALVGKRGGSQTRGLV